jgi:SpoVK/Ycf46/Vps4 family AAA+-type ATPase
LVLGGSLKEAVRDDVRRFFARQDFYDAHEVAWRRGLLFVGPPGNGKTHTIRALLREFGGNVVYVRSFRGQRRTDEQNMADVFARARRIAPCVLVLEDLDCLVSDATRSSLLNELDGLSSNRGILTIATTNHPQKLDRSLLDRPSRFDRKFHFPVPELAERRAFLASWCQRLHAELKPSDAALDDAVERSAGFTFAYLKELLVSTATRWVGEPAPPPVDALLREQVDALRAEMKSVVETHGTFLDGPRRIGLQ